MKAGKGNWAGSKMMTAAETAAKVRMGDLDAAMPTEEALSRIALADNRYGAFRRVRDLEASVEAAALCARPDLAQLPLAGVPIAVKDVTAVTGENPVWGSGQPSGPPFNDDSDIVARLRAAGAIIIGLTRVPELCLWPMTDTAEAIVRNPWAPELTAGGSSGGSAAAVAAGLVPIAHGTDAFGSVRSPAAICGLVGITPGTGTVRSSDARQWSGLYAHGPLATTVSDAALLLSVLSQQPSLARIREPAKLRIATSVQLPIGLERVPKEFLGAVSQTAEVLAAAGHDVAEAQPKYGNIGAAVLTRWLAGPGQHVRALDWRKIEPRTRHHLKAAALVRATGLVRGKARSKWILRAQRFFGSYDALITPMLATMPPKAIRWREKGWLPNVIAASRLAGYLGPWDLAGFPAVSVPAGRLGSGLPIGVQIVAPPGGEARLLSIAAQLEALRPWPRIAT